MDISGVIVVPDHDAGAMACTLRSLLANPPQLEALAHAARQAVVSEWAWDVRIRDVEKVYRHVLKGRAS